MVDATSGCLLICTAMVLPTAARNQDALERILDPGHHHLGDSTTPSWTEASAEPEGTEFELSFEAPTNSGEVVLCIESRGVDTAWELWLNDRHIGQLQRTPRRPDDLADRFYPVPAGALVEGLNHLRVSPSDPADDITVGRVRLVEASLRDWLHLTPITVRVLERETGRGLPARITITDADEQPLEVWYAESPGTAVRPGLVYVAPGGARLEVPAGARILWASRGPEWSRARHPIALVAGQGVEVELELERVVDTRGWIACDTHLHTLTFSGHGDSSIEERMVTLAGEGVELAVATDHNHNTDYRPWQAEQQLGSWFTPVVGNEVTTEVGHFNAFPLDPEEEIPAHDGTDYVKIVAGIRAKGAKVVILNHPRWPDHARGPFGVAGLDPYTGARALPLPVVFDATELVNSTTTESDPMQLFRDWFSLLNCGERVAAVGSSDSHTVGDPVGQGRTYVASSTDEPAAIDLDEACTNIREGRSTLSLGIFVEVEVDAAFGPGALVPLSEDGFEVGLRIACPRWVRPERARIFVNGIERHGVALEELTASDAQQPGFETSLTARIDWPHAHDAWVVCVVDGAEAGRPFWPMTNAYTLGASNPVFIDADRDGA
jgi:hypothetical protein